MVWAYRGSAGSSGASKPAANGYYEVDMSPETVHLKLTVNAGEDVAVALVVEVRTLGTPVCILCPLCDDAGGSQAIRVPLYGG